MIQKDTEEMDIDGEKGAGDVSRWIAVVAVRLSIGEEEDYKSRAGSSPD